MRYRASSRGATLSAILLAASALAPASAAAQVRDTIPSQAYYAGVEALYSGQVRDAQRTFTRGLRGATKTLYQGATVYWVDAICYHAMLGETYYHWGQPAAALEQFDFACSLFLEYPRWMLRVQFDQAPTLDATLARTRAPWGASGRRVVPGRYQRPMSVSRGQLDQSQAVQQGGVVQQAQLWPVDVVEVVRCTALAIRRRNELLGPLGPHDAISKRLVVALSRGGAPPNHWSGCWIDVQRGLAHAGVGENDQALQYLSRGTLAAGQFDHPLTSVALLEQGRLALLAGNVQAAAGLLAEAGYSAYQYEDAGVIDDAFHWGELARIAGNVAGLNPALTPAAAWARRERLNYLASRLNLALSEELMTAGNWKNAGVALAAGAALLGDARTGVLGNWAAFLDAKLDFAQNRNSAPTKLAAAIAGRQKISVHNFQIARANAMFDAQTLPTRSAPLVYAVLLADPSPADSVLFPLEWMAVMQTPQDDAFQRWLLAALDRKNLPAALEISDRAKRRRFHNALPWGGRLDAVRDLLATPAAALPAARRQQQHELELRFPAFAAATKNVEQRRSELDAAWLPALDKTAEGKLVRTWDAYADALTAREHDATHIALARVPADYAFPPLPAVADLQAKLAPGQALLVYHDTPQGLLGMLVAGNGSTFWNCGPSSRLGGLITQFLRDLGNIDGNHEMSAEDLAADKWHKSGHELFTALFEGAKVSPTAIKELIVVPDGVTWYVPFEALVVQDEERLAPLISFAKLRYAPTIGLAFSFEGTWRRVKRTGIAVGDLPPGDKPEARAAAAATLDAAVDGPLPLATPPPAPSPMVASLLDSLIVLADVETQGADPLAWSPLPIDRQAAAGSLDQWLALPGAGPQRVLLPGMHTLAERGGKGSRRRSGSSGGAPGDELFFASCSLMSAGAETILLSRWRVGGQSTLDLVREFIQEAPHTSAPDAWQRSVQLAMTMPVDPVNEQRVKAAKTPVELTASHPFFWAGYLVVDSGWRPEEDEPEAAAPVAGAAPPAAAPAPAGDPPLPPQPPAAEPAAAPAPPGDAPPAAAPAGESPPPDEEDAAKPPPVPPRPPQPPAADSATAPDPQPQPGE